MPTNFQNAANQLQNRLNEQYQGPDVVLPPQAVGPNVATPEIPESFPRRRSAPLPHSSHRPTWPRPTTPVVRPPIGTPINPGGIVPVDRGQIRQDSRQSRQPGGQSGSATGCRIE